MAIENQEAIVAGVLFEVLRQHLGAELPDEDAEPEIVREIGVGAGEPGVIGFTIYGRPYSLVINPVE